MKEHSRNLHALYDEDSCDTKAIRSGDAYCFRQCWFLSFTLFLKNALQYVCVSAKMNNRARVREYRSAQRVCRAQPLLKERMKICWITNV